MASKYVEDALTLGARLKEEEKARSDWRIERAIPWGNGDGYHPGGKLYGATNPDERAHLAALLYEARYDGLSCDDPEPTAGEVLENFCFNVFGCSFDEVLKAWDRELDRQRGRADGIQ